MGQTRNFPGTWQDAYQFQHKLIMKVKRMMLLTSKEVDVRKCMATPNRKDTRQRSCYLAMISSHQKTKVFFNELKSQT